MNTREKAQRILISTTESISAIRDGIPIIRLADAKEVAQAYLDQQWIPVSERLPEEGAWVFCATDRKAVFIGWYDDGEWVCESSLKPLGEVIHWMNLPEAP